MDFAKRKCVPCEGGTPRMASGAVEEALGSLPGWTASDERTRLHRRYRFQDFVQAMRFVNALAALAETEGHHPDFAVHWSTVDVTLFTHVAGGLTQNDFVVAAKLDLLPEAKGGGA